MAINQGNQVAYKTLFACHLLCKTNQQHFTKPHCL